jgi:demethylmenaquinone methyltransferase/2-methoxy-6-polyprenyl-1,4-benzoquinol methylase
VNSPAVAVDKRGERVRRMFGQIAPWYDFLNHLLSLNIDRTWRTRTAKLVPPAADGPILDVCTGTGDLALTYYRTARGNVPIIGADFCPEMLELARAKASHTRGTKPITFIEADAQALPFPTDHFQLVTIAFGLRNVADTDRGLAELIRVTRPGGRVAILEFSKPRHPLLGRLYLVYFRHVLPRIGQILSRSQESAYHYLPASVLAFPDGEALAAKLRSHGLTNVRLYPFTFGIATLYVGEKPAAQGAAAG